MLIAEGFGFVGGFAIAWLLFRAGRTPPARTEPWRYPMEGGPRPERIDLVEMEERHLREIIAEEMRRQRRLSMSSTDAIIDELREALDNWTPPESTEPDGPDGFRQIQLKDD